MTYQYPFLNPELPLQQRVDDLISRLTPDEKAGFIPTRNQAVERLDIPAFAFGAEGAHGFVDREGNNTTFPQTIGLASGWDRELLRRVGEIASTEARAFYKMHEHRSGLAIWSPTIDMERDPRWGRTEEGYGEDPFLAGELSSAYIRGAQGDDPFYLRVSCGPKHFFANNNEKNRVSCSCSITPRCMHEYYLAPFRKAIKDAKAVSMMTSYNEVNGIPMMLHPILNYIVKKEWGIEGNIVTDGGDFLHTVNLHHYFETHSETLAAALKNGGDSMTDNFEAVITAVKEALDNKLIEEKDLDEHLRRILSVRFRFGHFDPPGKCPYDKIDEKDLMKEEYRKIARDAVRKSIVLLKNEDNTLPLRPDSIKGSIAVIGPLADKIHLDWYSGHPEYICTPLEGLRELYGNNKIIHADCRDIVSFTTEDGRPLVISDTGHSKGKLLCAGTAGQAPARFYREDWGWGSQTLTDVESGLLIESPYWKREMSRLLPPPVPKTVLKNIEKEEDQCVITVSGKSTLTWFGFSIFNLIRQENGLVQIRTYGNQRLAAPEKEGQLLLHDDPLSRRGELFRMKIEKEGLPSALEAAAKADQVIVMCGSNPMINGRECIDRPSLDLPPVQEELINSVSDLNPNTILVMISGYPFTCGDIIEKVPAAIWMAPGIQETGHGLADVIGGGYSPAGRLPLTWYEDESQLPSIMEYDIISAGATYQYFTDSVLFPFGHGLSYSSFTYSNLTIDKTFAGENDTVSVSFKLKNSGSVKAEEVPQMYVTVSGSFSKRPLKTLKGFDRIMLSPGEEKTIRFDLPVKEIAVWDSYNSRFCVEAGNCTVLIGSSSADIRLTGSFKVSGEITVPRKISGLIYAERFDNYYNCYLHEKRGSGIAAVFNNTCDCTCGCCDSGWIRFVALDFADGISSISAIVQGTAGSRIEIRLDAPDGVLAGVLEVPNTGDIYPSELNPGNSRRQAVWAYAEDELNVINGIHDLYLVLYGKTAIWSFELG
ncbi:MAG: glycoside hydrolase family 3 C-terminal domain-containing protein [Treponema sp.]|nr:glycoside hydrolase family 3 C-terminal domain-containing protein [Treponema sp.]MCL2273080.1 glycoside hydrolase family 3 C-terminal domain-containing protein [Treponema sp.]